MTLRLSPMNAREASEIADWHYEPPYSFYDWTADSDDLALLLDEHTRAGRFFSVHDDRRLVGFFEFKAAGDEIEVGLGLHPDLTARALGQDFLESGLDSARQSLRATRFRLSVAAFNTRAIRVYERCGFVRVRAYRHATNGG